MYDVLCENPATKIIKSGDSGSGRVGHKTRLLPTQRKKKLTVGRGEKRAHWPWPLLRGNSVKVSGDELHSSVGKEGPGPGVGRALGQWAGSARPAGALPLVGPRVLFCGAPCVLGLPVTSSIENTMNPSA